MENLDIIVLFIAVMYVDYYIYLKTRDWFKELFYVVKTYDSSRAGFQSDIIKSRESAHARYAHIEKEIDRVRNIAESVQPELHMDIHQRSPYMQCIMIGVERGRDTVQIFNLEAEGFEDLLRHARYIRRRYPTARLGHIDATPDVKAVLHREWM